MGETQDGRSGNGSASPGMSSMWVDLSLVRPIIMTAVEAGGRMEEIFHEAGMDITLMGDPEARISLEERHRLVRSSIRSSGEPLIGLLAGQGATPMILGLAGHLMQTSATMGEVFRNLARYSATFSKQIGFEVRESAGTYHFIINPVALWEEISIGSVQASVDMIVSSSLFVFKLLSGRPARPVAVNYRYPRPTAADRYEALLHVRPGWLRPCNEIVLEQQDMSRPVIGHNPILNRHFQDMLEEQLAANKVQAGMTEAVKRTLLKHYAFRLPNLMQVAGHLNMTPRTLQRKLADEGTTFQQVADSVKRDLSIGMLANKELTVAEVAYKLGYGDQAAFQRAFKQWTGSTPGRYRLAL